VSINPVIKLRVDLSLLGKYFQLNHHLPGGFEHYLKIDRQRHDEILGLLNDYNVPAGGITHDLCFIVLWIEKEIEAIDDQDQHAKEFREMWEELDGLKDYLVKYRITSVKFEGESERDLPGESFIMKQMTNIDRLCDGIRSVFKDEFHHDKQKRKARGQRAWKRRKMEPVKNSILNWMLTVPELDILELEEQNEIIEKLGVLAGLPE
jgi:hypothetical protein